MRIDKFTQKMQEALQAAQDVAAELNQQEITNEHFLLALLDQTDGVTRPLLEKMGVPVEALKERLGGALQKLPRVTGGNVEHRIGNDLRSVLDAAEKEMAKLKDEFLSAEHYLLALTSASVPAARALKELGVTRDKLMQALQQVRGSQRVTDQNPEGKYQTLEKYGRDLTSYGAAGQDRSGHRARRRNPPRDAGAFAPHEKQSGADRRTGRRQDGDRRRPGAPHHLRRRAGIAEEQDG